MHEIPCVEYLQYIYTLLHQNGHQANIAVFDCIGISEVSMFYQAKGALLEE